MSEWFFMLGQPLSAAERDQVREYSNGLGLEGELPIESVPDFGSARRIIVDPEWDRRWWEAEQRERERLSLKAASVRGSAQLLRSLSQSVEGSISAPHGAAAVQAARAGCVDAGLIQAAAGAAGEALYLGKLAELAGESSLHPFSLKLALFAGGHWPLGVLSGRYYVF